jgi:hypothetical protein
MREPPNGHMERFMMAGIGSEICRQTICCYKECRSNLNNPIIHCLMGLWNGCVREVLLLYVNDSLVYLCDHFDDLREEELRGRF